MAVVPDKTGFSVCVLFDGTFFDGTQTYFPIPSIFSSIIYFILHHPIPDYKQCKITPGVTFYRCYFTKGFLNR